MGNPGFSKVLSLLRVQREFNLSHELGEMFTAFELLPRARLDQHPRSAS